MLSDNVKDYMFGLQHLSRDEVQREHDALAAIKLRVPKDMVKLAITEAILDLKIGLLKIDLKGDK